MRGGSEAAPKQQHQLVSAPQTDTSSPSDEPIPPDTVPSEEPSVTPQATGLKQEDLGSTGRSKRQPKGVPADAGGCDFHYGAPTQCVPTVFPDGIEEYADKCLWLKVNGFTGPIQVHGSDRQKLDPDGDKIACNS